MSDDRPPVTHYHLGPDDEGFYAEFLTPLSGSEDRRDGRPDVTERISGIVAQKLRYLEVLLIEPWIVRLDANLGFHLAEPADVRVTNPASYIAQKLLIHSRRSRANRAKDVLYTSTAPATRLQNTSTRSTAECGASRWCKSQTPPFLSMMCVSS